MITRLQANPAPLIVKLKGLQKDMRYEVNGKIYSGSALMYGGMLLPVPKEEYESFRYEIKGIEQEGRTVLSPSESCSRIR